MIDRVFIDLDGVIANHIKHLFARLQLNTSETMARWPKGQYYVYDVIGKSEAETHDLMDEAFWLTAELTEEAKIVM